MREDKAGKSYLRSDGLFRRLSSYFFALLAVLAIVQIGLLLWMFSQVADESEQRLMKEVACDLSAFFAPYLHDKPHFAELATLIDASSAANPKLRLFFLDQQGTVIGSFGNSIPADGSIKLPMKEIREFLAKRDALSLPFYGPEPERAGGKVIFSACETIIGGKEAVLYVPLSSPFSASIYRKSADNFSVVIAVCTLIGSAVLAAVAGGSLLSYLRQRLETVFQTVRSFGAGDFSQRIVESSTDEIGELSRTINRMADALEENIVSLERRDALRRELIADVSHDLRGPVAGMKGYIGVLQMMPQDMLVERAPETAEGLMRSCAALEHLLDELFELAKLEAKAKDPQLARHDLTGLCRNAWLRCVGLARSKGVSLRQELPTEQLPVRIDANLLERAVVNLLENGINYTPSGGAVTLSLSFGEGSVTVAIADEGIGIPADEVAHVFGRFVQGSSSEKSTGKSGGLGLAIVQRIIELHQSSVKVTSKPGEGSTFYFSLPLEQASLSPATRDGAS